MSSKYVRDQINTFIANGAMTETLVQVDAEYLNLGQLRKKYSLGPRDPWLGIQHLPADEIPFAVASDNTSGHYREEGTIYLHLVEHSDGDQLNDILTRGETLRNLFRGATINGDIRIKSVDTVNFNSAVTLQFENGYEAGVIIIEFYRNFSL